MIFQFLLIKEKDGYKNRKPGLGRQMFVLELNPHPVKKDQEFTTKSYFHICH